MHSSRRFFAFGRCFNLTSGMIHPTAIVESGAHVAESATVWHFCHIMPHAEVGEGCSLGQNVVMMPHAKLGRGCRVQNNVSLYTGVVCQDEVFLGPSCVFTNVINPRAFISRKEEYRPTHVGRGATIGANATVICGVSIGAYAMVGAGAVVSRDVPEYALVYGNPARIRGWVSRSGHKLDFSRVNSPERQCAKCPHTGEVYELRGNRCTLLSQ